jgi:transposase-like protein
MVKYDEEQKRALVARVQAGESITLVAKEAKTSPGVIRSWRKRIESGGAPKKSTITDEMKYEIVRRLKAGEKVSALAVELKIAESAIRRALETHGGNAKVATKSEKLKKAPKGSRTFYPDEFKAKVTALYNGGEKSTSLEKRFNVDRALIARWARGFKTRGPFIGQKRGPYKNHANGKGIIDMVEAGPVTAVPKQTLRTMHSAIGLLRGVKKKFNTDDPVHLVAAVVLATLEGKM